MTARDVRALRKLTIKLTEAEARSEHIRKMIRKKIGFREEEEFLAKEERKLRGTKINFKKKEKIVSLVMQEKLRDNEKLGENLKKERNRIRKEIEVSLGPKSEASKTIFRQMGKVTQDMRKRSS